MPSVFQFEFFLSFFCVTYVENVCQITWPRYCLSFSDHPWPQFSWNFFCAPGTRKDQNHFGHVRQWQIVAIQDFFVLVMERRGFWNITFRDLFSVILSPLSCRCNISWAAFSISPFTTQRQWVTSIAHAAGNISSSKFTWSSASLTNSSSWSKPWSKFQKKGKYQNFATENSSYVCASFCVHLEINTTNKHRTCAHAVPLARSPFTFPSLSDETLLFDRVLHRPLPLKNKLTLPLPKVHMAGRAASTLISALAWTRMPPFYKFSYQWSTCTGSAACWLCSFLATFITFFTDSRNVALTLFTHWTRKTQKEKRIRWVWNEVQNTCWHPRT